MWWSSGGKGRVWVEESGMVEEVEKRASTGRAPLLGVAG